MAGYFFTGVGHLGHRDWPITDEDIEHMGDHYTELDPSSPDYHFFPCYDLIPYVGSVSVAQSVGRGYAVNWTNSLKTCVPGITIEKIETCVIAVYQETWKEECVSENGTPGSAFISFDDVWDSFHVEVVVVLTRMFPYNHHYGKKFYEYEHGIENILRYRER